MVLFVFVSLDQHFSAEGLLWIVDSILMGQTKLPIIPPLILWTCTQNFCQFCDHLELIYQDNNGMGGIHGIQLIKCYPQFNVVDYPLETANGIQQWLIDRQKRLKLWQNRMYHHGICQSWFSEEKVSIQKFLLLVKQIGIKRHCRTVRFKTCDKYVCRLTVIKTQHYCNSTSLRAYAYQASNGPVGLIIEEF